MSCGGCNKGVKSNGDERTRAAICETCWSSGRGLGLQHQRTAVVCTVSGHPVSIHFSGIEECPLGKYGQETEEIRWLGVVWYGVPFPLRAWLRLFHWKHPEIRSFPGCGCIKILKDAVAKWLK